jgi:hypothetical protein
LSFKQKIKWVDRLLDVRRNLNFYQTLQDLEQTKLKSGTMLKVAKFTTKLKLQSQMRAEQSKKLTQPALTKVQDMDEVHVNIQDEQRGNARKGSASLSIASEGSNSPTNNKTSVKQNHLKKDVLGPSVWMQERKNSIGSFRMKQSRSHPNLPKQKPSINMFSFAVRKVTKIKKGHVDIDSERFGKILQEHKSQQAMLKIKQKVMSDLN